ncbi:MAG TPA: restriction endonuclease [Lysobacter sp.]|nr:restriction endonuclease [Lysobacter sp.]
MAFKGLDIAIEVTVKDGDTSKQRGDLLEALSKRVLVTLQYEQISAEVRVTGCELDIIAQQKQAASRILVECKAYRDRKIAADVITKMLGNLWSHDYRGAWLITTSELSKDANGLVETIRRSPDKAEKLRVYGPVELVQLLVDTNEVVHPSRLGIPALVTATNNRTLLLTDIGEYWAVPVLGEASGVSDTVLVFDAKTGAPVTNEGIVQQLNERDSNLRDLTWVAGQEKLAAVSALKDAALRAELDNIAPVPVADDWADYRPSRPTDFVGRDSLLTDIVGFLTSVAEGSTATRLLAIKAPSGWGKSSFLIKLRSLCTSKPLNGRVFLYAVDCRTASSARYPELALKKCLEEAAQAGFLEGDPIFRITSAGQPFADETVQGALAQLKSSKKVVVLFFDQFEEITTKQELADLFVQVRALCTAVESAAENIVLGFSWKTDGTIPTDHPAYHVWHSFADRRREFELPLFSRQDTSKLLSRLSRELKQPIEVWLRRLLAEHSQGYPWLLKKLCVHVFRVLQAQPARQRELFERALDVQALFEKDLSDLNVAQVACLEKIAKESPADNFQIVEQFGHRTVDALMARRLVLRNAGKLVVYWDIFRDYVLFKQVPAIPMRYIPVSSPASARKVLEELATAYVHLSTLSKRLGLQQGTLDNIARDLVMMGVCQYDRKNFRVRLIHGRPAQSVAAMMRFFSSHAFLRVLVEHFGPGFKQVPFDSVESILAPSFDSSSYETSTIHGAIVRWLSWQQALGILTVDVQRAVSHNAKAAPLAGFDELRIEQRSRRGARVFKGEASPGRVVSLIERLIRGGPVDPRLDRNALYVLRSLRLVPSTAQPVILEQPPGSSLELWLALKVYAQPSVQAAWTLLHRDPGASANTVGELLVPLTSAPLSDASKRRYGSALQQWVQWLQDVFRRDARVRLEMVRAQPAAD